MAAARDATDVEKLVEHDVRRHRRIAEISRDQSRKTFVNLRRASSLFAGYFSFCPAKMPDLR
jgi:hypothetical protein